MKNPWLDIPLSDYEGHMALPGVAQAQLLAEILAGQLRSLQPASLAAPSSPLFSCRMPISPA
jgi:hypothetical protein